MFAIVKYEQTRIMIDDELQQNFSQNFIMYYEHLIIYKIIRI